MWNHPCVAVSWLHVVEYQDPSLPRWVGGADRRSRGDRSLRSLPGAGPLTLRPLRGQTPATPPPCLHTEPCSTVVRTLSPQGPTGSPRQGRLRGLDLAALGRASRA